jgi:hypothetical protein
MANREIGGFLSGEPAQQEQRSLAPWIIAGAGVLLVIAGLLVFGRSRTSAVPTTPDAYAGQLAVSDIALSQSSNMAGSQITYVDGVIANHGDRVVDGVTVQTVFHLAGAVSQVVPGRLSLIRTRDPYVDIEPVSAEPLKPGEGKPFRLIFDHVDPAWDQQPPEVRVMQVHFR